MSRRIINLAYSINLAPDSFPLDEHDVEEYLMMIGRPYGTNIPPTYEVLLNIINDVIHEGILIQHQAYIRSLPLDVQQSLQIWTGVYARKPDAYHNIRLYMENPSTWKKNILDMGYVLENESDIIKWIKDITFAVMGSPILSGNITAFRRVSRSPEDSYVNRKYPIDYRNRSFTSTTTWFPVSGFIHGKEGTIIKIILPPGTRGLYIGGPEYEILLPPNTQMKFLYHGSDGMPNYVALT